MSQTLQNPVNVLSTPFFPDIAAMDTAIPLGDPADQDLAVRCEAPGRVPDAGTAP